MVRQESAKLSCASSNLAGTSKNRQSSTEDCRFLLVTYALFTLHYNLVADFWEVIGNSEQWRSRIRRGRLRQPFAREIEGFCVADYQGMQWSKAGKTRIGFDESTRSLWNQRWSKYPRSVLCPWRADFIAKLQIALKECSESEYWLELLIESGYYEDKRILEQCVEIKKLLISSINTAKNNLR